MKYLKALVKAGYDVHCSYADGFHNVTVVKDDREICRSLGISLKKTMAVAYDNIIM